MVESGLEPGTYPVGKRVLSDRPHAMPAKDWGRFPEHTRLQPVLAASRVGSVGVRGKPLRGLGYDTGGIDRNLRAGCQREGRPTTTGMIVAIIRFGTIY